jgi:hypothetical protein
LPDETVNEPIAPPRGDGRRPGRLIVQPIEREVVQEVSGAEGELIEEQRCQECRPAS